MWWGMENARKLIFLDIDGTLVAAGQNTPPASALRAIRGAQARGHLVCLCTGRNLGMAAALLPIGFDAVIASAGGYIEYQGQILNDEPMTAAQLALARRAFAAAGVSVILECRDVSYADTGFIDSMSSAPGEGSANSEMERWRAGVQQEMRVHPITEYTGEPVYKISFMGQRPHPLDGPDFDALRQDFNFCIHEPGTFGPFNGEIINRKFNKGDAVRRLAERLGIPLADTIAFGDSMNDYEMIVTAGTGICMGNGSPRLKAVADEVCGDVDKDGLYNAFAAHGLL